MPQYHFSPTEEQFTGRALLDDQNDAAALDARNRAVERENRMASSQALNDEVQRYEFEKQKVFDEQAKATKIATDARIIEATQKLFKVNPRTPGARDEISTLGAEYADVVAQNPRLAAQLTHNATVHQDWAAGQDKLAQQKADRETAAAEKQAIIDAKKQALPAGAIVTGGTVNETGGLSQQFTIPDAKGGTKADTIKKLAEDMKAFGASPADLPGAWQKRPDGAMFLDVNPDEKGTAGKPKKVKDYVTIPAELHDQFQARYNALTGAQVAAPAQQPAATEPAPAAATTEAPVLTSKDQFDALPSGSHYIRDGVRYQKP